MGDRGCFRRSILGKGDPTDFWVSIRVEFRKLDLSQACGAGLCEERGEEKWAGACRLGRTQGASEASFKDGTSPFL